MTLSRKENVSQKVNIYFHLESKRKDELKLCPHNFQTWCPQHRYQLKVDESLSLSMVLYHTGKETFTQTVYSIFVQLLLQNKLFC